VTDTVLEPTTGQACPALSNVTILVSNYLSVPHPEPFWNTVLDSALGGFDQALRALLPSIHVPAGSRVVLVDVYNPSIGREGLGLIQRRLGYTSGFNFDFHPTNVGHAFIAERFASVWQGLQ